jgi:hypothetical protein
MGIMDNKKSEFSETVLDMSRIAGVLAGDTVVAGKKLIRYLNDLTIVDTILKQPADEVQITDSKTSRTNTEVD